MNAPLPAVFSIPERIFIISNGKKQRISPIVWNRAEKPGHRWQQVWDMQSATGVIPLRPARPPASTPIPRNSPGPHNRPIQPQNAISHTRRSFAKSKVRAPATRSKEESRLAKAGGDFLLMTYLCASVKYSVQLLLPISSPPPSFSRIS